MEIGSGLRWETSSEASWLELRGDDVVSLLGGCQMRRALVGLAVLCCALDVLSGRASMMRNEVHG